MSNDFTYAAEPEFDVVDDRTAIRSSPKHDVFVTVIAGSEVCFALLRLGLVALSSIALSTIAANDPMRVTVPFEIGTGGALGVFGLVAAVLLLFKIRVGVYVGWLAFAFAMLNILVGVWQASIMMQGIVDPAQRIGGWVGAGVMLSIRVAINVAYAYALVRAAKLYK